MRKAQMIGQIFIFVLAALIFILILTYGYRAISNFLQRSEQVALIDFKTDLESAVETIKRDYGSVKKIELLVPKRYTEVCFVDPDKSKRPGDLEQERPLMYATWLAGSENVFLVPKQEAPIYLEDIAVEGGYTCISASHGKISLRLEGTGRKAKISEWLAE
ncbi:MAG: hypothetical protein QW666_02030 [Candidatus Woesearchaeota archaeon]